MSSILAHRRTGPRVVQHNAAQTLDLDVYVRATQAQATATVATLSIWLGDKLLVDEAAASALGPPASYSLLAATTSAESLSEQWAEVWTLAIGSVVHKVRIGGYLVLYPFVPPITQDDLIDRHRGLEKLRHPDDTTFVSALEKATSWVERQLIKRGRRPWQVVDSYALEEALELRALYHIYSDAQQSAGGGNYRQMAADYKREAADEIADVRFRLDLEEDGFVDSSDLESAAGPIMLTCGPVRSLWPGVGE